MRGRFGRGRDPCARASNPTCDGHGESSDRGWAVVEAAAAVVTVMEAAAVAVAQWWRWVVPLAVTRGGSGGQQQHTTAEHGSKCVRTSVSIAIATVTS